MRRFQFPLESLLKVRRVEEQQTERLLQQAQAVLRETEASRARARSNLDASTVHTRQLLGGTAECPEILLATERHRVLEQLLADAMVRVSEAQKRVDECIDEYRERRRGRESLDELRDRAWRAWAAGFALEVQHEADARVLRDYAMERSDR